jgi:hypothetical protein
MTCSHPCSRIYSDKLKVFILLHVTIYKLTVYLYVYRHMNSCGRKICLIMIENKILRKLLHVFGISLLLLTNYLVCLEDLIADCLIYNLRNVCIE